MHIKNKRRWEGDNGSKLTPMAGGRSSGRTTDHVGQEKGGRAMHTDNEGQGKKAERTGQVVGQWQHNGPWGAGGTVHGHAPEQQRPGGRGSKLKREGRGSGTATDHRGKEGGGSSKQKDKGDRGNRQG